jgi:hypothetical protein
MGTGMSYFMADGLAKMAELKKSVTLHEERLFDDWEFSAKLPRKQKKKMRKAILAEYEIVMYSKSILGI